jgi:hypothetical protein
MSRVEGEDNQPPDGNLSANQQVAAAHHDALEFPDGRIELLTILCESQAATVLQLPAQQTITAEADAQKHIAYVS